MAAPPGGSESSSSILTRRPSRSAAMMTTFSQEVFDNEVVPSSLGSITPILRVAAELDTERPRVAYLCERISTISVAPFIILPRSHCLSFILFVKTFIGLFFVIFR